MDFKHRSSERDLETDRARVGRVASVLDAELLSAEKEREGLRRRLDDLSARASISQGNDTDEYLTRDDELTEHLNLFDAQMRGAEGRLKQLDDSVAHFRFLKDELSRRFPILTQAKDA
ncbi:MAG: hypothetical protein V4458_00915 [Pseudomonadota bacterium]|nr:hypothetical protein [Afipia sp.]